MPQGLYTDELSWELVYTRRSPTESFRRGWPIALHTPDGILIAEGLAMTYEPPVSLFRHRRTGEERVELGNPQGRLHIRKLIGPPRTMRKFLRNPHTPMVSVEDSDRRIMLGGVVLFSSMATRYQTVGVAEEVEFLFETMSEANEPGELIVPMM
jgi:hypothetical protein